MTKTTKQAGAANPIRMTKRPTFVPKLNDVQAHEPIESPGRPSSYDEATFPKIARNMARAGSSEAMIARAFGVSPSTLSRWKAEKPAFRKALAVSEADVNAALQATAVQRALGYSYETEKAFQTGVRMTVTETALPDPHLLKFLLERRMPGQYRETKEVIHTHDAGKLFQAVLERMDAHAKGAPPLLECAPEIIEVEHVVISPPLAQGDNDSAKPLIDKDNDDDVTS